CTSSPSSNTSQSISGLSSSSIFPLTTTTLTTTSLNLNLLQQLPIQFPKDYLPKLLNDTTKWTSVFQNEWAEISIYINSNIDNNDILNEMNDTSTISSSSFSTTTTTTPTATTTTTTTTNTTTIPITTNNSCPSLSTSEIKFEHVNELNSFFNDGLLTYSSISTLFGIPDKTGFQEIDQVLRKTCLCDLDGPNNDGPVEWAHCVYDANYHPTCAFSIELQWLVVTGGRMAELVSLF
ncbi:uncharacterized protein DC041_0005225, partial [Schistosoma bovis]